MKQLKRFAVFTLALTLLSACSKQADNSDSSETSVTSATEAVTTVPITETEAVTTVPITATEQVTTTTEEQIILPSEPYSFTEVNSRFHYDLISVKELGKIYGEPVSVGASHIEAKKGKPDYFILTVEFEGITFELEPTSEDELQLKLKAKDERTYYQSPETYEITEADMNIRLKPQMLFIDGEKWELPRKIKMGCSEDSLFEAYNGNKGRERFAQGLTMYSYDYGETGRITYGFEYFSGELSYFLIEWYDAIHWEDIPDRGLPPA